MKHYDVIIIGGGPAGSMAGIALQKKGYKTCIIDKSAFPREKLCGGLLTLKTMELLRRECPAIDADHFIVKKTNLVHFYLESEQMATFQLKESCYLTERTLFDHTLIGEYRRNGGEVIENRRVKPADIHFTSQTLQTGTEIMGYRYLVGADGCNSVLLKRSGTNNHNYYCIEGTVPHDPERGDEMKIFFGVTGHGYGWQFPKEGYDCLGVGGANSDKSILEQAGSFFSQLGVEPDNRKGAPIPSGRHPDLSHLPGNTLLVGDAGGYTDPITGEGIYLALLTGLLAGEAIDVAIRKGSKSAAFHYAERVRPLQKNIAAALRLHKILYRPFILRWFMQHLRNRPSFGLFYLEKVIATNEYDYRNFIRAYFLKHRKVKAG